MVASRTAAARIVLLALLLSTSGCYAHVKLEAPLPTAPVKVRAEAYEKLRPVSYQTTTYTQNGLVTGTSIDYLRLHDGRIVHYPEDLLQVVARDSTCAKAVDGYLSASKTATTVKWIGYPVSIGGMFLALSGVGSLMSSSSFEGAGRVQFDLGLGLMLAGAATVMVGQWVWGRLAGQEAETAFQSYDEALLERLHIRTEVRTVDDPGADP